MDKDTALRLALEFVEANHSGGPDAFELIDIIKASLEAKDEPVAWMYIPTGALFDICPNDADEGEFLPLYANPPQRTWVGLTDEEIASVEYNNHPLDGIRSFARAIEAKLKEKNGYA